MRDYPAVWLNMQVALGETLNHAAAEAVRVAQLLGVGVILKFNDSSIYVRPTSTVPEVLQVFHGDIPK